MYIFQANHLNRAFYSQPSNHSEAIAPKDPIRLLSLPRELRDMIWTYAVASPFPILIWGNTWIDEDHRPRISTKLLLTCKQIYQEAGPLLYQENTFVFSFKFDPTRWRDMFRDAKVTNYQALAWVLHDPPLGSWEEGYWNKYVDHVLQTKIPARIALSTIHKLDIQLLGPQGASWDKPSRVFDDYSNEARDLSEHVAVYLPRCLGRCTSLKKLQIMVSGWKDDVARNNLEAFLSRQEFGVEGIIGAEIVWWQDKDDAAEPWITKEMMYMIMQWSTRKAISVMVS